jgi:hypothetical protein
MKEIEDYEQGQLDLIDSIKKKVSKTLESKNGTDMMLDVVLILKSLKPIQR